MSDVLASIQACERPLSAEEEDMKKFQIQELPDFEPIHEQSEVAERWVCEFGVLLFSVSF